MITMINKDTREISHISEKELSLAKKKGDDTVNKYKIMVEVEKISNLVELGCY